MFQFTRQLARFAWLAATVVICACSAADAAALPQMAEAKPAGDSTGPSFQIAKDREVNNRSVSRGQDREGDNHLHISQRDLGTAPAWLAEHATNLKPWRTAFETPVASTDFVIAPACIPQRMPLPPPVC